MSREQDYYSISRTLFLDRSEADLVRTTKSSDDARSKWRDLRWMGGCLGSCRWQWLRSALL